MGGLARLVTGLFLAAGLSTLTPGCVKFSWMGQEPKQKQEWTPTLTQEDEEEDTSWRGVPLIPVDDPVDGPEKPAFTDGELQHLLKRVIISGYFDKRDKRAESRLREIFSLMGIKNGLETIVRGKVPKELRSHFKGLIFKSRSKIKSFELARYRTQGIEMGFSSDEKVRFSFHTVSNVVIPSRLQISARVMDEWMRSQGGRGMTLQHIIEKGYKSDKVEHHVFYYPTAAFNWTSIAYDKLKKAHKELDAIIDDDKAFERSYLQYSRLLRYRSLRKGFHASENKKEFFFKIRAPMNGANLAKIASTMIDFKELNADKLTGWQVVHVEVRKYLRAAAISNYTHFVCGDFVVLLHNFDEEKKATTLGKIHQKTIETFFGLLQDQLVKNPEKYRSIKLNSDIEKKYRFIDALSRSTSDDLRTICGDAYFDHYGRTPLKKWSEDNPPPKPKRIYNYRDFDHPDPL